MSNLTSPQLPFLPSFDDRQKRCAPFLDALRGLHAWAPKDLITDYPTLRKRYSGDESGYTESVPIAAVAPETVELVSAVVKLCVTHQVSVVPRGAGTGLEGGCTPYCGGLVLDTGRLLRLEVQPSLQQAWVGAGVKKMALLREAEKVGLVFGPDPSSNPCIGGMASTSGSGMSTLKYGTTRENILSLTVVTATGEIIRKTRPTVRKCSSGLDLTQLYIGSEGTLGVICEVCVRLFPLFTESAGAMASFDSLQEAVTCVVELKKAGVPSTLLRCELLSKDAVVGTNAFNKLYFKGQGQLPVGPTLLLEFVGSSQREIKKDFLLISKLFKRVGRIRQVVFAKKGAQMDALWSARRVCGKAAMRYFNKKKCITTDVCVELTALAPCIVETEAHFQSYVAPHTTTAVRIPCIICAHIADGNFHVVIPYETKEELTIAKDLETAIVKRALRFGGTVSGEHGIGVGKVSHVVEEHGAVHVDQQQSIKQALDPHNIMNPGGKFYPFQQEKYPVSHL